MPATVPITKNAIRAIDPIVYITHLSASRKGTHGEGHVDGVLFGLLTTSAAGAPLVQ